MQFISFLIVFPLIVAIALFFIKNEKLRDIVVVAGGAIIAIESIITCIVGFSSGAQYFTMQSGVLDFLGIVVGVAIAAVIIYFGVTYKNKLAIALACVQVAISLVFELGFAHNATVVKGLYYDNFSLLLAFIIGVIGSGICIYALGYMKDFQAHENAEFAKTAGTGVGVGAKSNAGANADSDDQSNAQQSTQNTINATAPQSAPDRRPFFFGLMFLFLSAMFVIVFSNNMTWMFTGWEVTTVCSFLLIGYTRTPEALKNAFRQINMNLLGGIAFALALISCVTQIGTLDFSAFISYGVKHPHVAVFAVTALSFAGLTKAAQAPFHTWLLGAMVAPTPTSALLHSSTMVKAGVFLLVKLSPVMAVCQIPSYMVMIVGGFTFLACSLLAISQSNAKRVLAYSTIANLGLIAACAGVGSAEAVWAASFLILFHAIAKSLLFLCVGTAEHHIGSRNIEDMDLLFVRMPLLARFMLIGIMCMFIAPFGMLVGKWATLVTFIDSQCFVLIFLLVFGSAATFMFWAKWFGKLSGIASLPESQRGKNLEKSIHISEWCALGVMMALILICCALIPMISVAVVEPYLFDVYGIYGMYAQSIDNTSLWIMSILTVVVFIVILVATSRKQKTRRASVYMAGISIDNPGRTFRNSMTGESAATAKNWYLESYFGEGKLQKPVQILSAVYIALLFVFAAAQAFTAIF